MIHNFSILHPQNFHTLFDYLAVVSTTFVVNFYKIIMVRLEPFSPSVADFGDLLHDRINLFFKRSHPQGHCIAITFSLAFFDRLIFILINLLYLIFMVLFFDKVLNNLYLFSEELVLFVEEIECLDVFLLYLFKHVVNFFQ